MSWGFPVAARLAAEVALGYEDLGARPRAREDQLQILATAGFALTLVVGYQVACRWQQIGEWRRRASQRPERHRRMAQMDAATEATLEAPSSRQGTLC